MNFNLDRDLVFFDLESTGADVVNDRIFTDCQEGNINQVSPKPEEREMLINPQYIKPDAVKGTWYYSRDGSK